VKKIIVILVAAILFGALGALNFTDVARAQTATPTPAKKVIYKFWSKYCPHCKDENIFLEKLEKQRSDFEVKSYEVTSDASAADLFKKFSNHCGNSNYSVPALFIGTKHIIGFKDEATTGKEIIAALDSYTLANYPDPYEHLNQTVSGQTDNGQGTGQCQTAGGTSSETNFKRKLPFLGEVDLRTASLPLMTVLIGTVDGFNPCAMWALVALLSLLVALGNRKRVLLVGGTFLLSSWLFTFVYLLAWLNFFTLVKFDLILRLIVGAIAIYTAYQLFMSYRDETEECKVSRGKGRVYRHIERLSQSSFLPFLLIGAFTLAVMVNIVELMCTINLPVIYTKVLSMANLPRWQYYLYIGIYDVFYMLDDIIVFLIALISMKAFAGFNKKYSRFTKLIGAIVMFVLGISMLFFPRLLSF